MNLACSIAETVSEVEQTELDALPPLYETLDVEALERSLESMDGSYVFQFTYCDCTVIVTGEDEVSVCAVEESEAGNPGSPL